MSAQFMFRHQLHATLQQRLQLLREGDALCEQIVASGELNQKIDIAVRPLFTPCDRSKHAYVTSTIAVAQGNYGIALLTYFVQ